MTKKRGAILGFGQVAEKGHWPSYAASPDLEIVAVMDVSPKRQALAQSLQSDLRVYATADELFQAEKLDFVDICTPPSTHALLTLQALQHGAHVLCEKPLVLSSRDYQRVLQESQARQRVVFSVHNWLHAPAIQKALSLIREGRIGTVWHVEIFVLRDTVCSGAQSWRTDPSISGGGILVDHGWHSFYLLMALVGAEPTSILSKMLLSPDHPDGLEEAVQALVEFPKADGYIHLTWRAPTRRNSIAIQGLHGTILIDDNRVMLNASNGQKDEWGFEALSAGSHHPEWFIQVLPQFANACVQPARNNANLRQAGWCVALTTGAYLSNMHGFKPIEVHFPGTPEQMPALI